MKTNRYLEKRLKIREALETKMKEKKLEKDRENYAAKSKRENPEALSARQKMAIRNVTSGKFPSPRSALRAAGYAQTTPVASVLNRPLVKSALTDAMDKIGLTHEHIVLPIKRALTATRSFVSRDGDVISTDLPDYKYQLEASRDAVAIFGGVPKVGEGTPTAHGLNLFIAVDTGQGRGVQVSAHGLRPTKTIQSEAQLNIQVQDQGPKNIQAGRPDPRLND